jgi:hypothetical protein
MAKPMKPVKPVAKPVKPVAKPVKPVAKPMKPVAKPVKPVAKPVAKPVKPVAKPAARRVPTPVAKSTKPATKPVARSMKHKDAVSQLAPLSDAIGKAAQHLHSIKPPMRPIDEVEAEEAVAKAATVKAAKAQAIKDAADAPRIECRLLVGDLSLPVDATNLERTLGAGRWERESLVDSWPDAAWSGLLAHLKLPAFPLDRTVASTTVKRLVQRLWYEAIKGGVPEERAAAFAARDAEKAAEYTEEFKHVTGEAVAKSARAKESFGKARGGAASYMPTPALKAKDLKLGGQAGILLAAFKTAGFKAMTTQEATDAMVTAGLKTATDPKRIASFYLSQWATKKGLLTRTHAAV